MLIDALGKRYDNAELIMDEYYSTSIELEPQQTCEQNWEALKTQQENNSVIKNNQQWLLDLLEALRVEIVKGK